MFDALLILFLATEKFIFKLDNTKYFGSCYPPGRHMRNISNFVKASNTLVC